MAHSPTDAPRVGILILNYHHPEETLACIRRLMEVEGLWTRILWIENDAAHTELEVIRLLESSEIPWIRLTEEDSLPPEGCIGFLPVEENLGYGGGNNVGLRFLHRNGVEFTWIMNNDTFLAEGGSRDLLRAAETRPEVGLWGMSIASGHSPTYLGGLLQERDFAASHCADRQRIESDPLAFISGCAMFFRTELGVSVGCIPEEYFLYYEDLAFSWEFRKRGHGLSAVEAVVIRHAESLSTGHRSSMMEYYNRRNRWHFIRTYFPERLRSQVRRFFTYQMQKLFFRLRFDRVRLEWRAYRDFRAGRMERRH